MKKVNVRSSSSLGFPMPVLLIGADVEGKPNFLAAAWVMRCESSPPQIAVALAPHHTNLGMETHKEFSVNVPGTKLVAEMDYCGIYSGNRVDKSLLFTLFRGELDHAPMIAECSVAFECRLVQLFPLAKHTIYIGSIENIFADEHRVENGRITDAELDAILLSSSDKRYYAPGEFLARGWSCGKQIGTEGKS